MARIEQLDAEEEAGWKLWVSRRPEAVRRVAERLDMFSLYRLKPTGQRVTIAAYAEDGSVRVNYSPRYNLTPVDYDVFGVNPDDLEPCDLPASKDCCAALAEAEVGDWIVTEKYLPDGRLYSRRISSQNGAVVHEEVLVPITMPMLDRRGS